VSTSARFSTPACRFCKETPLLYGNCSIVHPHPTNPSRRPTPPPSSRSPVVPPPLPRSPFVLASTPPNQSPPPLHLVVSSSGRRRSRGPPPSFFRLWIRTPRHIGAQGGDDRFTWVNQLEKLECSSPSSSPSPFPVLRVADTRDEGTARWWQSLSLSDLIRILMFLLQIHGARVAVGQFRLVARVRRDPVRAGGVLQRVGELLPVLGCCRERQKREADLPKTKVRTNAVLFSSLSPSPPVRSIGNRGQLLPPRSSRAAECRA
jgi:hypothetical protein